MSKLPDDWKIVNLEEVITKMRSGGTPKSTNEEYYKGNIPFVKIDDITSSNKFLIETKTKISEEALNDSSAWLVPEGVILYSMYASLGFVAINKLPVATNQAIMSIIPDTSKIDMEYLYQFLLDIKNKIDKFVDQTTQKNLNAQKVRKFKIPLPPLQEQKKIAEILSTVDQKIAFVDNQIEETELLKKGLMQKLLTEGIGHTEFKDSEIGRIPKSWDIDILEELTTKIGDGLHGTPKYVENSEYYFINGNNLNSKIIEITDNTKCISKEEYLKNKKVLNETTVLLSINGTIGSLAYFNNEKVMLGKSIAYMNVNDRILKQFLFYTLKSSTILRYFLLELTGTTIRNLSLKTLRNTKIPLPPLEEQKQIAEILSTADEKLENLKVKKESFEELKKGLMQKLLTGEVRV
ncbi:restriction endonuclease subunit S [Sulfurimonas paralvinellae]|uniref:Restriction endonuclease subunit S n=1 Tax=Sulfurimonas paralvinellae TaxID=317658 RepID=A0A7M1BB87_9BACT|nr:restriction endonuclease subunit S [Sulfurimonas paralvinellae]QOP46052.1 restriction endonuclease subunit S [Sulfurimonas paralvinellae]